MVLNRALSATVLAVGSQIAMLFGRDLLVRSSDRRVGRKCSNGLRFAGALLTTSGTSIFLSIHGPTRTSLRQGNSSK